MLAKPNNGGPELRIRLFQAHQDPCASRAYSWGQKRALADFGIEHTTSSDIDYHNPDVFLLTVETVGGGQRAGLCICRHSETTVLPIVRALGTREPKLLEKLARLSQNGVAELCAGWVAREHRGRGLYAVVIRAALAVLPMMQIRYGIGFGWRKTIGLYKSFGFVPDDSLGEAGEFCYPDERYRSTVMWGDCEALSYTTRKERDEILRIREALRRNLWRPKIIIGDTLYDLKVEASFATTAHGLDRVPRENRRRKRNLLLDSRPR